MTLVFYIIIDFLALVFCALSEMKKKNNTNLISKETGSFFHFKLNVGSVFYGLSFLILFVVVALRDGVGADYNSYMRAYYHVVNGSLSDMEDRWLSMGYQILCKVIGYVSRGSYQLMFAVVGFLTIYFFYKAISNISVNRTQSLFVFISFCLYYQCFNQIRQMLAMAICMYALTFICSKNNASAIKFFILILIAVSFHPSSIVMAVLYFVKNREISKINILLYFLGSIAIYLGYSFLIKLLQYTNYGITYLNWSKYNVSFETSSILNLGVRIIMLLISLLLSKETIRRKPYTLVLFNSVIICTIIQVLTLRLYLFGRITTYFFGAYIFLIPELLITVGQKLKAKSFHYTKAAVYFVLLGYHFVYYFSPRGATGSGYGVYKFLR